MKKQRKLIPAIAMLLVSATMLSSASFAWFTMNSQVSATGMQVTAKSPSSLLISVQESNHADANSTIASPLSSLITMTPSSTNAVQLQTGTFYEVLDSTGITYNAGTPDVGTIFAQADTILDSTTASNEPENADVVKHTFWIADDNADGVAKQNLHVSGIKVTTADGTAALNPALRVGVVCGEKAFIYAPEGSELTTDAIIAAGTVAKVEGSNPKYKDSGESALSGSVTALQAYSSASSLADSVPAKSSTWAEVNVYIWYEGSAPSCTSKKAIGVGNLTVEVSFSAEPTPVE